MTSFDAAVPVAVIGGGACGLTTALAAHDEGAEVVVLERDPLPRGSTAMSSGMIPACNTAMQKSAGIDSDSPALMATDIQRKAHGQADAELLKAVCAESGPALDWLSGRHGLSLELVDGPPYPGHSVQRTHAPPSRLGEDLSDDLARAVQAAGIDIVTNAQVTDLFDEGGAITGLQYNRPDGGVESLGVGALVMACCGFGGNPEFIEHYIPEMAGALYYGHEGNRGDAVRWGLELGAALADMGAYQGHGSVAVPHAALVSWSLMNGGGILVNNQGRRFADESEGSSETAAAVITQPDAGAWAVIDQRLHESAMKFTDYRQLADLGAVRDGEDASTIAEACGLPPGEMTATLAEAEGLSPPYYAIRVTGALLHTQGGLAVDRQARVLRGDGSPLPNLFAGGGAARGVSGRDGRGYLSGNGLLTAITLGRIAGREAARLVK